MIKLVANPPGAPGCVLLRSREKGGYVYELLIQTDWDWPGVASSFGWSISKVKCPYMPDCEHEGTDGTVKCKRCKTQPVVFIQAAREWIDEHDGKVVENPGYDLDCVKAPEDD